MATTNVETHILYNGEIKILFYPDSHRYKLDGNKTFLIGVTTACGMKDKSTALLIWASRLTRDYLFSIIEAGRPITQKEVLEAVEKHKDAKDEAAGVGTQIHSWIEQYVTTGIKPETPEDERVKLGVIAFLTWVRDNKVEFEHAERVVYSREYEYVGQLDAIAKVNGVRTLLDYKSSKGIYLTMRYQVAAYVKAWNEEHNDKIEQRMILRLGKDDGAFQVETFTDPKELEMDFRCFLACLLLKEHDKQEYNWQRMVNSEQAQPQIAS